MIASPIVPGALYRVKGLGLHLQVIARNGCEAIQIALNEVAE